MPPKYEHNKKEIIWGRDSIIQRKKKLKNWKFILSGRHEMKYCIFQKVRVRIKNSSDPFWEVYSNTFQK